MKNILTVSKKGPVYNLWISCGQSVHNPVDKWGFKDRCGKLWINNGDINSFRLLIHRTIHRGFAVLDGRKLSYPQFPQCLLL